MTELVHIHDIAAQADRDSWTPVDLTTLPDKPPVQPDLGNTGLLYPGKRHVFSGPPDSAKTIAAYCVLLAIVRGNATGALIDFEMGGYDARQRLRELGATDQEIQRVLYLEPDEPATLTRIAALVALEPALVVVDAAAGAYELQGLDDNQRKDVEKLSRLYVREFWKNGIATLFIDHVVKNTETRGRFMIGSERKLGGVDVHYGFDTIQPVSRGTAGHYKLIIHRDRGGFLKRGHLADLHLDSDPDTHQIAWSFTEPATTTNAAGGFRPTHLMEKVSIYLELCTEPVTRNTIYDALGGTKKYVLAAINALVNEGFATEVEATNRARPVTSLKPYRENDESANPQPGSTMPAEPPNQLPHQANNGESANFAQPSGGSVVHEWFGSGSRTTRKSGGSVVHPPTGVTPPDHPTTDHPDQLGWFTDNGHLTDTPDLEYLDTIAPDDIDWSTP